MEADEALVPRLSTQDCNNIIEEFDADKAADCREIRQHGLRMVDSLIANQILSD